MWYQVEYQRNYQWCNTYCFTSQAKCLHVMTCFPVDCRWLTQLTPSIRSPDILAMIPALFLCSPRGAKRVAISLWSPALALSGVGYSLKNSHSIGSAARPTVTMATQTIRTNRIVHFCLWTATYLMSCWEIWLPLVVSMDLCTKTPVPDCREILEGHSLDKPGVCVWESFLLCCPDTV